MTTLHKFSNLLNLLIYFKDEQVCLDYLETIRWNRSLQCPYKNCEGDKIFRCANHKYKCAKCKRVYSVKVGTIFEGSKLPLQKWYVGIYLITAHKKGISSLQLSRDLSITQKSAWFLLHRVRFSLRYNTRKNSETLRFDTMLNNINGRLTYPKLIANGNTGNNNKMEAEQGSLGF